MTTRPNILFLMSDEHRPDVTGYEGNDVVRTPVLDALARDGVVFRNAYTPSPSCIPARQALAAGQLPKTCDCRVFGEDLTPGYMTWTRRFSQYAYETICCGKMHHTGPDQMQGWNQRISFDDIRVTARNLEGKQQSEFKRYERATQKWSDTKEVLRAGVGVSPHAVSDVFSTMAAEDSIRKHFANPYYDRESQTPLVLKLSLLLPHYPYLCDEEKFTYYLNRVEPFENQTVFDHPFLGRERERMGEEVSPRDRRRASAAYYGMTETIDTQYGQALETLRHVGENLDDWIIIYTSDHGEMLGEHGIWEKKKFFEASARVPLIIRWPQQFEPRVVDENVNLCDLFATLCDLADLPIPDGLDSRSLVPLMRGDATGWNNESISQFAHDQLMIKRDNFKYQWYGESMPEVLFDLAANPAETINFAEAPEYSDAMQNFRKRRAELGYGPDANENYVNAGYGK